MIRSGRRAEGVCGVHTSAGCTDLCRRWVDSPHDDGIEALLRKCNTMVLVRNAALTTMKLLAASTHVPNQPVGVRYNPSQPVWFN